MRLLPARPQLTRSPTTTVTRLPGWATAWTVTVNPAPARISPHRPPPLATPFSAPPRSLVIAHSHSTSRAARPAPVSSASATTTSRPPGRNTRRMARSVAASSR